MTLIKWILGLLMTLVVLILAVIIIVPQVIDPNDYRDDISNLVRKQTGRDLAINGDLKLSIFPWIGVRTKGLTLSQPRHLSEAFGDGNMFEADETEIKVKALPLLKSLASEKKDIRVATIVLKQPKVHIIKTRQGLSSFDGIIQESNETNNVESEKESMKESAAKAGIALVVQGVDLQGGLIIWEDRLAKQRYEVNNLQLRTGNLLGKELVDIKVSAELLDSSMPDQASFSADGKARLDIDSLVFVMQALTLNLARGDLEVKAKIDSLDFVQGGIIKINQLKGDINLEDEDVGPAKISVMAPNIAFDQSSNDFSVPSLVANGNYQKRPISLESSELAFNFNSQNLSVKRLDLGSDDIKASILKLLGQSVIDKPKMSGDLTVQPFNLRSLLQSFDVDYEPELENSLTQFSLATRFSGDFSTNAKGNSGQINLQNLRAQLDESTLQGAFSMDNVFGAASIDFDLNLDQLNIDNYAAATKDQNSSALDSSSMAVPLAIFKQFKANGNLNIDSLVVGGAKVADVAVVVKTQGNMTEIKPSAKLYEGGFDGVIKYQETSSGGKLTVKQKLNAIQLEPLLTDTEITDQLSGLGNVVADIVITEKNGIQTNQGGIKLSALNGAIKGVDIKKILDDAQIQYNQYKGREVEEGVASSSDETRFAEMGGFFKLNNFVLDNADFALKAPLFRLKGKGRIDIEQQRLDYGVDVSVVNSTEGQGGQGLDKLKGATIPVKIYGPLTAPKYKVDLSSLLKVAAKDKLKEKLGIDNDKELSTKELIKQRLAEKYTKTPEQSPVVDKPADAQNQATGDSQQVDQQKPKTKAEVKEEAKEELKKRLLDSLFN